MKTQVKPEITSAAIFRCTAKCTFTEKGVTIQAGQSFYRVNSDTVNDSYIIHWNGHQLVCNCPSHVECKHLRGVKEVMQERKQYQKQRVSTPVATIANYDVVGAAVKVFDQAVADAKIGNHYELVGAMYQARQALGQDQHPDLDSCIDCGNFIKRGTVVCAKCLGC